MKVLDLPLDQHGSYCYIHCPTPEILGDVIDHLVDREGFSDQLYIKKYTQREPYEADLLLVPKKDKTFKRINLVNLRRVRPGALEINYNDILINLEDTLTNVDEAIKKMENKLKLK